MWILSRPKASKILQELLSNSQELLSLRPTKLVKNFKGFQKIKKKFQKIPKVSKKFHKKPKDSTKILKRF